MFLFVIGFLGMIIFIVKLITDIFKKRPKKVDLIGIGVCFILFIVGSTMSPSEDAKNDLKSETVSKKDDKDKKEHKEEVDLNITGDLDVKFKDNKAIITITTNAIDGSMFEVAIMNGELDAINGLVEIKEGKAIKEFDIKEEWKPGYMSAIAMMMFNSEDNPQPEKVREVYGENGEKIKGDLAQENNLGGNNVNLESKTIAYPDEETVKSELDGLFNQATKELIDSSNGVIVDLKPRFESDDWSVVSVVVSDAWYNSQEHEKERFAEQASETVTTLVKNGGKVEPDKSIMVYIVDTYGKELASPKVLGGYKIKR